MHETASRSCLINPKYGEATSETRHRGGSQVLTRSRKGMYETASRSCLINPKYGEVTSETRHRGGSQALTRSRKGIYETASRVDLLWISCASPIVHIESARDGATFC
jgi:hypothetical protein